MLSSFLKIILFKLNKDENHPLPHSYFYKYDGGPTKLNSYNIKGEVIMPWHGSKSIVTYIKSSYTFKSTNIHSFN
jgi:hypothetical protein